MEAAAILQDPLFEQRVMQIVRRLPATQDPWFSPREVSEYLSVSKDHVLRALRSGALEYTGAGKLMRVRQSAADRYLASRQK